MLNRLNITCIFRSIAIALVIFLGSLCFNTNYDSVALAADNYSAPTDTYQETRNPNRVNTDTEELKKSNINQPEATEEESIYDRLVDKVDRTRNEALEKKEITNK